MKRILPFCLCLCCVGLTSCFRTNLYVGNARPDDRKVKVSQEAFNHHFVGGLIPGGNTTMTASEYVDDADSFVVQTSTGFLNGLVGGVTAGIYTPTQTKFYLPVEELNKTAAAGRESAKEEEEYENRERNRRCGRSGRGGSLCILVQHESYSCRRRQTQRADD